VSDIKDEGGDPAAAPPIEAVTPETQGFDSLSDDDKNIAFENFNNDKAWKTKNRLRSEELNRASKVQDSLKAQNLKQHDDRMKALEKRERDFNMRVKADREKTEQEKAREYADSQVAIAELMQEYPDFTFDKILKHYQGYDQANWKDHLRYGYLAERGSRMEEITADARAGVVRDAKKKSGLPPTGKISPIPKSKAQSMKEAEAESLRIVRSWRK